MDNKECAKCWETVVKIYKETIEENNPNITATKIIEEIGLAKTLEVFATISAIKKHDGRIYGINRQFMNSITVNPESIAVEHGNAVFDTGLLDEIHTVHIDNIITQLRKVYKVN